ncbi:interleukin-20-like [Pleurodeles waltl]|uniref:interleukin-20-like n=1 Tax=Pleurodeles waltl TaxID=8319 RepID=UPI0037095D7F
MPLRDVPQQDQERELPKIIAETYSSIGRDSLGDRPSKPQFQGTSNKDVPKQAPEGDRASAFTLKELDKFLEEVLPLYEQLYGAPEKQHLQDTSTDVTLLDIRLLNGIQHTERCCFLRELLRFYLNKIFKPLEATNSNVGGEIKSLANSFLSMKLQLKHCRDNLTCLCGEQSRNMMDIIEEQFQKLDEKAATMKAVGEINILIHWIKNNIRNQ